MTTAIKMNTAQAKAFVEKCNEAARLAGYGDGVVSINTAEAIHQLTHGEPVWKVAERVVGWAAEHCYESRAEMIDASRFAADH